MQPPTFEAVPFGQHRLLDSGAGEKLESFGPVTLRRPDPQALWRRRLPDADWDAAHLTFVRESDRGGRWEAHRAAPREARGDSPSWIVEHEGARVHVRPTPFKHVGVFPEQAANHRALLERGRELEQPRLLNLFGYTGVASVVCAHHGWDVTHVDASKASITWAVDNADASGLGRSAFRVVCEDALRFARREARRGNRYDAILLDPPHYGRGPKGEVWRLEEHLADLVAAARDIAAPRALVILSTYAVGYSPLAFRNLFEDFDEGPVHSFELAIREELPEGASDLPVRHLPAGFCARWERGA